jgi:hypothetical protein
MRAMASMFCNHRRATAAAVSLPSAFVPMNPRAITKITPKTA